MPQIDYRDICTCPCHSDFAYGRSRGGITCPHCRGRSEQQWDARPPSPAMYNLRQAQTPREPTDEELNALFPPDADVNYESDPWAWWRHLWEKIESDAQKQPTEDRIAMYRRLQAEKVRSVGDQ